MDNIVFNVKGKNKEKLLPVLQMGFDLLDQKTAQAFRLDESKGLIFYWHDSSSIAAEVHAFPTPMAPEQLLPVVEEFLVSEFAQTISLGEWDRVYEDREVESDAGWRVYTEDWGEVAEDNYAFLAVTPSWCWYSK